MTTETQTTLNGVPVDQLTETIGAVKADPSLAKCQFRARNKWVDGGLNRSSIQGFYCAGEEDEGRKVPFVYENDEPPVLLGQDRSANPVEFVLHALAGCVTTTLVYHAAARGIELDSVETSFEGDLDLQGFLGLNPDVRNGYENIRISVKVSGNASDEQLEELVQLAQRRSPVFDIVSNPVPIDVRRAN